MPDSAPHLRLAMLMLLDEGHVCYLVQIALSIHLSLNQRK